MWKLKASHIIAVIIALAVGLPARIHADQSVCETFMQLHKMLHKKELAANLKITASTAENSSISNIAGKIKDAKEKLDSRVKNVTDYFALGGAMSMTIVELEKLRTDYEDFNKTMAPLMKSNPLVSAYALMATKKVKDEITRCTTMLTQYTLRGATGLLRASTDQKLSVIYSVKNAISNCRYTLSSTAWKCKWMIGEKFSMSKIKPILSDDDFKEFAKESMGKWGKKL